MTQRIQGVIIDDESSARESLKSILSEFFPEIELVGEANSPLSAVEVIERTKPNLCFLDVEMPHGTGFDVLESLHQTNNLHVIFVTAHKEVAYKSFSFNVVDYLIKPIRINELKRAIDKFKLAISRIEGFSGQGLHSLPFRNSNFESPIVIPNGDSYQVVDTKSIVRCESSRSYTIIHLSSGKSITSTKGIGEYEDLLENVGFIRVHRSHLVNLSFISKFSKGRIPEITLLDENCIIPISKERKANFLKAFLNIDIEDPT